MRGLIGRKVGMTQLFGEDGTVTPVTVIQVGPCVVVQRKTVEKDGYDAVQIGLVDPKAAQRANRPQRGHHKRADVPPTRMLREFKIEGDTTVKPGDAVGVDIFAGVGKVDVSGTSKGKGFQGVMRRHKFRGGRATHGSMFHRAPGSIGSSAYPSRVMRGMRGAGQMGQDRVTVKNLAVVKLDPARNLLIVKGAVPGAIGSAVLVHKSRSAAAKG